MDMCASNLKIKNRDEITNDDVHIIAPLAPKKK
jgi:hypothetical protein